MITQLLTTALLAVSLNNPPKRATLDTSQPYVSVEIELDGYYPDGSGEYYYETATQVDYPHDSFSFENETDYYWLSGNEYAEFQSAFSADTGWDGYFYLDPNGFEGVSLVSYSGFTSVSVTSSGINLYFQLPRTAPANSYVLTATFGTALPEMRSVSFLLNHCTTNTAYPVVVEQGQTFTATFTAMTGYAFKGDNVAEYFDYPLGALSPIYRVSDYIGDYGSYWRSVTIIASVTADCTLTISPAPLDEGALQDAYDRGYNDAKTTYENTNQFSWLKGIWSGMAEFFSIEILPNISLGFLAFAPLLVVAVVAIVRILKHD